MKIKLILCLLLSSQAAFAAKPIVYKFKGLRCQDGLGNSGYNQVGLRPCTDFRSRPLTGIVDRFDPANLTASIFENRTFDQTLLRNLNMSYANFSRAQFDRVVFENVDLSNADFRGANFRSVVVRGNTSFENAQLDDKTKLQILVEGEDGSTKNYTHDNLTDFLTEQGAILDTKIERTKHDRKRRRSDSSDGEGEMVGAVLSKAKWDAKQSSGYAIVHFFSRTELLLIADESVATAVAPFVKAGKQLGDSKVLLTYTEKDGRKYLTGAYPLSIF